MLTGNHQYLLHYDFKALGNVKVAYLSRNEFDKGILSINSHAVDQLVDYLL